MNSKRDLYQDIMDTATLLCSEDELNQCFDKIAVEITDKMAEMQPLVLCVMNGGLMCTSEITKRLSFPLEMDYVHATRYAGKTRGDTLVWKKKPTANLANRNILIIDDILDGGITLQEIIDYCKYEGAQSVHTAVMLDKPHTRHTSGLQQADFVGLEIENKFVFGFGLDYDGYLRNVPAIYAVAEKYM